MEAMGAVNERIRQAELRLTANHDSIATLRNGFASQDTKIEVIAKEVEEARTDIEEVKTSLNKSLEEVKEGFDKKFENLITSVRWGTTALIGLIGVLSAFLIKGG